MGFSPSGAVGPKFGFVEVTSRTLLNHGKLEFSAEVDVDLPVEVHQAELDAALTSPLVESSEYLLVFDVALAKTRRKISSSRKQTSRRVVGFKMVPNPAHSTAQTAVTQAQINLQTANMGHLAAASQYCTGWDCLTKAIKESSAKDLVTAAQETVMSATKKLTETAMQIEQPIYQPYNWNLTKVQSTKLMTAHYYFIDRVKKTYLKSTFDIVEEETFHVAYKVDQNDPRYDRIVTEQLTEKDVVEWEEASSVVSLSQLIDHYLENKGEAKNLRTVSALRDEMVEDRNDAIAAHAGEIYVGDTRSDPRFESVVAIHMPDGFMGSGFYVTPDIVMTNYHVVDEGDFAEIRLYGGREAFGKVIARDVRLDLALVKVQERGTPVEFYAEKALSLGSTVEVIGHPKGYMYSIKRGVVSAVRKLDTANLETAKNVLHVQIDAPNSPGNSGGPVFMDNKVVSVVSWGRGNPDAQNLNFSIHYSEAQRFLNESIAPSS